MKAKPTREAVNAYREMLVSCGLTEDEASAVVSARAAKESRVGTIRLEKKDDDTAELTLYDAIGFDFWSGGGVTAKGFRDELNALGGVREILLRVNSPGGEVFDALTIYNLLREHPARVVVEIDGLAASAASFIAMCGDEIRMAQNAMMMIHNAQCLAIGDRHMMLETAAIMEKMDGQIAGIYAARAGRRLESFRKMMDAETWFTAEEAVENKLASKVLPNKKAAAMAFDLSGFKRPPRNQTEPPEEAPEGPAETAEEPVGDPQAREHRLREVRLHAMAYDESWEG